MKEQFIDVIKNHYFDFEGRARRRDYWMFVLWNFLASLAVSLVGSFLGKAGMFLSYAYCIAILLPSLGLGVRRLHDTGKSGWLYLIALIPLIGPIILLVWFCTDSQHGSNEYGPNPKGIN